MVNVSDYTTLQSRDAPVDENITLPPGSVPTRVLTGSGNDRIDVRNRTFGVTVFTGSGSNVVLGGSGNDLLSGESGVIPCSALLEMTDYLQVEAEQ